MTNKTEHEQWLDDIEDVIAYISNIDPAHPYIQELLDEEAAVVLQDYYASDEYKQVLAQDEDIVVGEIMDDIIVEDGLWPDE